jgi:hypothetical protein
MDSLIDRMQWKRREAAANAAALWRRLTDLLEGRRLKSRYDFNMWLVIVDQKQLAVERSFDRAIWLAKLSAETQRSSKD